MINLSGLPEEEALFLRRLYDLYDGCAAHAAPKFTGFLNERQQLIAASFLRQNKVENADFFGGCAGAVRRMCGFFPDYMAPDAALFPVEAVTLRYPRDRALSHRDFLGSLMALGIKRERVGDILPGAGRCIIFLAESVVGFVLPELDKVGSTGVKLEQGFEPGHIPEQRYEELRGTVSSPRMDSLVKLATGYAREKSAGLIRAGLVQRNYSPVTGVSEAFAPGDTVVIRGFGKYIIDDTGAPTRKGRIPVSMRKYL